MSELRRYLALATVISGILVILGFGIWYKTHQNNHSIKLNNTRFSVEVADNDTARARGLSGRDGLAQDNAMLFVFDRSAEQCFWMRDMKFAIDMVWLDDNSRVSAIERNVSPATYPRNFCHTGRYVIELSAGTTDRLGVMQGDQADL